MVLLGGFIFLHQRTEGMMAWVTHFSHTRKLAQAEVLPSLRGCDFTSPFCRGPRAELV